MDALAERGDTDKLRFQELLLDWCFPEQALDRQYWERTSQELVDITKPWCGDSLEDGAKDFLKWTEGVDRSQEEIAQLPGDLANVYRYESPIGPIDIELATIHAVKGETHTATLVLETYWYDHDLKDLLPFLIDNDRPKPRRKSRTYERMKRVFVGMTRPKELLCLAICKEHLDDQQTKALDDMGWSIQDLTLAHENPT